MELQTGVIMAQEQFNEVDRILKQARQSTTITDKETPDYNTHNVTGTLFQKVKINAAAPPG
jgi:hypothetical protein